jgi:hypothetical protein
VENPNSLRALATSSRAAAMTIAKQKYEDSVRVVNCEESLTEILSREIPLPASMLRTNVRYELKMAASAIQNNYYAFLYIAGDPTQKTEARDVLEKAGLAAVLTILDSN